MSIEPFSRVPNAYIFIVSDWLLNQSRRLKEDVLVKGTEISRNRISVMSSRIDVYTCFCRLQTAEKLSFWYLLHLTSRFIGGSSRNMYFYTHLGVRAFFFWTPIWRHASSFGVQLKKAVLFEQLWEKLRKKTYFGFSAPCVSRGWLKDILTSQ